MDKKRIITFIILGILAIFCAFLIVNYFAPSKNNDYSKNSNLKTNSKDFIDVDTYQIDNSSKSNNDLSNNTEDSLDKNIINTEVEINNNQNIEENYENYPDSYKSYLNEASETGVYDLSDIGNTILNDYNNTLNNEKKVSEQEVIFFNNLKDLADNYTMAYEEALSYIFVSDLDSLKNYLENEYKKTIDDFGNLDTLDNEKFKKIKEDYYNGMLQAQKGFNTYIANPTTEDCNEFFLKSDEFFYNGQSKLEELLEDYK